MATVFWNSVRTVRPDLRGGPNPWEDIAEPDAVRAFLAHAGVDDSAVVLEPGSHPLRSPHDWWSLVLGTRHRGTVEIRENDHREHVRRENLAYIRTAEIREVETNVIYAVATKAT